jgi:integrase
VELQDVASGQAGKTKTTHDAFTRYAEEVSVTKEGERWEVVRLAKFRREFPKLPMDRVSAVHVQEWRDLRLRQVKPGSVLREMKLLNSVFEQCRKEWKWIAENPCKDVRRPSSPKHRNTLITGLQTRKVLRALGYPARTLPRHAVAHIFVLALLTGMRAGELARIAWPDVHAKHIHLPKTKSDHPRDVPLSKTAIKLVNRMRGYHPANVFNISAGAVDTQFRAGRDRAGLSGFTFHDSRHTAATRIGMSRRLSLEQLCVMFGWSDPKMAMIYFNPSPSDIADLL